MHSRLLETNLGEPASPVNCRNCYLIALVTLDYPYVSLETGLWSQASAVVRAQYLQLGVDLSAGALPEVRLVIKHPRATSGEPHGGCGAEDPLDLEAGCPAWRRSAGADVAR